MWRLITIMLVTGCGAESTVPCDFHTALNLCVQANNIKIDQQRTRNVIEYALSEYLVFYPNEVLDEETSNLVIQFVPSLKVRGQTSYTSMQVLWRDTTVADTALGHEVLHMLAMHGGHYDQHAPTEAHDDHNLFENGDGLYWSYHSVENRTNTRMCAAQGGCKWFMPGFSACQNDNTCPDGYIQACAAVINAGQDNCWNPAE